MSEPQRIAEDLADIPPGPELASVLAGIEAFELCGWDAVEVLRAQYRQLNHVRARLLATMVEAGLAASGEGMSRRDVPDEFAADEVRAALVLTHRTAEAQFALAYDLCSRLPAVHQTMSAGACDEPRARVLSEWTKDLSDAQARAVCDRLLPRVGELTTGQLIEQIKKLAIAVDPDWARRRYEQAIAERKVVGRRNPDGSADLAGLSLPLDRVAAASARIDALAKAAKRAGSTRPIDHLRAELFLGMTDGTYVGLDDTAIMDLLLTTSGEDAEASIDSSDIDDPDTASDHANHSTAGSTRSTSYRTGGDTGGDPSRVRERPATDPGSEGPGAIPEDAYIENEGPEDPAVRPPERTRGGREGRGARGGIELRVRLSTLLGHDRCPADVAGWGPVHAELAYSLISTLARAEWRFVITDDGGQLRHVGITSARPTGAIPGTGRSPDVVELQVPATLLDILASDVDGADMGGWAAVVADLARQHAQRKKMTRLGIDPFADDISRRHPGAALRRYLQVRDRRCIGPGCRTPARHTDQDHTLEHYEGGPTREDNLGAACRHDHRLKTEGGWTLEQPEPGHFRWTTRLGHVYHVHLEPIIELLPDPIPRDCESFPLIRSIDDDWETDHILEHPPPENRPPPPQHPDEDLPPF